MGTRQIKSKKQTKDVRISFRLSKELYDLMTAKIRNDRLTESYVIRTALTRYLKNTELLDESSKINQKEKSMEILKVFTYKSTNPYYPNATSSHEYYSTDEGIFVNVAGLDGDLWLNQRIIPNQEVEVQIIISQNTVIQDAQVKLDGNLSYFRLDAEEIDWLAPFANMTVKKPLPEEIQEAKLSLAAYLKEVAELSKVFQADGFSVKDVTKNSGCALEITKKEVTVRIWVDETDKGFSYQAGYIGNPFSNRKSCVKRETLLKQANEILDQAIKGLI
jgi:hypothetical protein